MFSVLFGFAVRKSRILPPGESYVSMLVVLKRGHDSLWSGVNRIHLRELRRNEEADVGGIVAGDGELLVGVSDLEGGAKPAALSALRENPAALRAAASSPAALRAAASLKPASLSSVAL